VATGDLERAMEIELAVWAPLDSGRDTEAWIRGIAMENTHIFRVSDALVETPSPALPRLGELEAATLVVVGDRDVEEIHRIAEVLVGGVSGAHKREIHDGDLLVMVRQPEVFNRVVLDFLSFRT
jgi:pimeloyl-ACP methyl ester carboxylesterase